MQKNCCFSSPLSLSIVHTNSDSLSLPIYDGSYDPSVWIRNAEAYFSFHQTPIGHKVDTASFHLQGRALDWFWSLLASRSSISWLDFVTALRSQFGSWTLATIDHIDFKPSSLPTAGTIETSDIFNTGAQSLGDLQASIDAAFIPIFEWVSAMEVRTQQLADHSEMSHEKDSLDLDSGLHEFGDCFPTQRGNQEPEITFHNSRNVDLNMTQFESFPEISQNNENLSSSESSSTIPSGALNRPHASTIVHPTSAKEADFLDLHGGQTSLGKPELPKFSGKHRQEEDNGVDAMGEKLEHSGKHTGWKEVNTVSDGHVVVLEKSCSLNESSDESLKEDQTLSAEMDNSIFSAADSLIQISSRNTGSTSDIVADVDQMEIYIAHGNLQEGIIYTITLLHVRISATEAPAQQHTSSSVLSSFSPSIMTCSVVAANPALLRLISELCVTATTQVFSVNCSFPIVETKVVPLRPPPEPPPTATCFPHFLLSLSCSPPVRGNAHNSQYFSFTLMVLLDRMPQQLHFMPTLRTRSLKKGSIC